jgi:peptide/nickel transport system substrate-binding protein
MYEEQRGIFDRDARRDAVFEAERYVYEQVPVVVLAYPKTLQAYRGDRFTGWTPAPGDNGYLLPSYNYHSLVTVRPVTTSSGAPPAATSPGFPVWVWGAAIAVVVALIAVSVVRGRRDREAEA